MKGRMSSLNPQGRESELRCIPSRLLAVLCSGVEQEWEGHRGAFSCHHLREKLPENNKEKYEL